MSLIAPTFPLAAMGLLIIIVVVCVQVSQGQLQRALPLLFITKDTGQVLDI